MYTGAMILESAQESDKTVQRAGLERILEIEKIDQILANEEDELSLLHYRILRNSYTLLCSLPIELLSLIFLFCTYGHPFFGIPDSRHEINRVGWISITHVCHHLRTVALETASLWSSPPLEHSSMALEMIRRSKDSPLRIALIEDKPYNFHAISVALQEIKRVSQLEVYGDTEEIEHVLLDVVESAPLLVNLDLSTSSFTTQETLYLRLPRLFGCDTPKLSHLRLQHILLKFDSPIYRNITCLILYGDEEPEYVPPSLKEWMSLLSEMPKLRKLDVGYLLPSIDSRPSGIATPFLPHLQALLLSDTLSKCANFIEHLSFPDSTCVHLCFCGFDTTSTGTERDDELRLLNPVISRLLSSSGTNDRHVERLELGQRTGHRKWLEVTLWISGGPDSEPLVEDDCCRIMEREELPRFEVEISKYAGPSGADEMLQIILPSLRLEKLREVVITTDSDFLSSNTYARFFAGLPELRIFAMDNPGFHNFVETLSRTDIQPISSGTKFVPSNSGDPTIAFPALERISLRGSSFDPVSDSSLDRLIDACKIRKAHNTIIPTVEVINFTLPDEQLALCRAALGDNFCVW